MKLSRWRKLVAAAVAVCGLVVSPAVRAAEGLPAPAVQPAPVAVDVALGAGGLLSGQVVDAQGTALKGAPVAVWHESQQVAQSTSDESGRFAVTGLRTGVHYVVAGQGYGIYRLWSAQTAPPAAKPAALIVSGETVVRGQNGNMAANILTSPILWGAVGYTAGHIIGFNSGLDKSPKSP